MRNFEEAANRSMGYGILEHSGNNCASSDPSSVSGAFSRPWQALKGNSTYIRPYGFVLFADFAQGIKLRFDDFSRLRARG
jgi:hypothetical protein